MSSRSNSGNNNEELRYQPMFNSKQRLVNPLFAVTDFMNIISITRNMYGNLYPNKKGDEPMDLMKAVKESYKAIRELRIKNMGKKMMGLNSHLYAAICLHSALEYDQIRIPVSSFIYYINDPKVSLVQFEKYKKDPSKGFLKFFNRTQPQYLKKKKPSFYITNYLKNRFDISQSDWNQIGKYVRAYESKSMKERDIASHILYACILAVLPEFDTKVFGIKVSSFSHIMKQAKELQV